ASAFLTGVVDETYTYDASGRRPGTTVNPCCGTVTNSYYSQDWQVLQDVATPTPGSCGNTTTSTYTWGLSYIDDIVERDQSVNGGAVTRGRCGSLRLHRMGLALTTPHRL